MKVYNNSEVGLINVTVFAVHNEIKQLKERNVSETGEVLDEIEKRSRSMLIKLCNTKESIDDRN